MIPIARPIIGEEEKNAVNAVLDSGMLAQGEKVKEFEENFAEYLGVKHAIATTSGTQALIMSMLGHGITGEVLVPSFSFIASATSVVGANAKPVFVDVNENTFLIDLDDCKKKLTEKTEAIMPVHLYGQACNMSEIHEFAEENDLIVIEDACQAHGATWKGKKVGSFGTGNFSFYPTKNMTTAEGGMVTTNDDEVAEKVRLLRDHGMKQRYYHESLGWNYRMTNLQGAIGVEQLKKLDGWNKQRQENAKFFDENLNVETPKIQENASHVYHQYTIKVPDREKVIEELKKEGIGFGVYYPVPIHKQEIFKSNLVLPVTENLCEEVVSLPVRPDLTGEEKQLIVETVNKCF